MHDLRGMAKSIGSWRSVSLRVGENARSLRERANLTQERVAELAELHANYYGRLERGEENPTLEVLVKIARALGVPVEELVADT